MTRTLYKLRLSKNVIELLACVVLVFGAVLLALNFFVIVISHTFLFTRPIIIDGVHELLTLVINYILYRHPII